MIYHYRISNTAFTISTHLEYSRLSQDTQVPFLKTDVYGENAPQKFSMRENLVTFQIFQS